MTMEVMVTMVILLVFTQGDIPKSWHLLSCVVCLCAAAGSQALYYNYCHTWSVVTRARWCGPWAAWCGAGYSANMGEEETDQDEDMYIIETGQINEVMEQTE